MKNSNFVMRKSAVSPTPGEDLCSPAWRSRLAVFLVVMTLAGRSVAAKDGSPEEAFEFAATNGVVAEEVFRRTRKLLHAWLAYADPRTLLLPDHIPGYARGQGRSFHLYTPHNSGADNYPYLIATAFFTAVRTRGGTIEDATFGHNAAMGCHMANYAYFNNTIATWDSAANKIRG